MALRADDVDLGRDRDLVARFQNGDPDAFDDLYRRYFDRLRRYCLRRTRDAHEAEEVAQEAFVKAYRALDTLEGERRFYPWMTVIAKRIVIDRHRRSARVDLTDAPEAGTVEPDHDHLFAAVDAAQVREALANVGPRHREVLLLRETESMSYADIAGRLEVPVTTVEALLHRARKALRREYAAIAGAHGAGLWGLPALGALAGRVGRLRARLDARWAEAVAVAAPLAAGAVAAALFLPGGSATDAEVETVTPSAVVAVAETDPSPPSTTAPAGDVSSTTPATVAPAPAPPDPAPTTTLAPPTIDAGPLDVYVGAEATEVARAKAEAMPLHGTVGETTGGADVPEIVDDLAGAVDEVVGIVVGRMPTPPDPGGTP